MIELNSQYQGISHAEAAKLFLKRNFIVPYQDGVRPEEYVTVWQRLGKWVLDQGIFSPDIGTNLVSLLSVGEKQLSLTEWASLSEKDHIAYPVILLNNNLTDGQRGKVRDKVRNERRDPSIAKAITDAQNEWASTAILNYYKEAGIAFDVTRAENLHDEMCLKSASYVGLHLEGLERLPQYVDASKKYREAITILRTQKEKSHARFQPGFLVHA